MAYMMAPRNLLLLGATGFIGGTIMQQLLDSSNLGIRSLSITVVVRQSDQAAFFGKKCIKTYIVTGLDDAEGLELEASKADIVVNAASGQHSGAPKALIQGLAKRRAQTGQDVFFIHLSGTTNIAVPLLTRGPFQVREFYDNDEFFYDYERVRDSHRPYGQRTADINVIQMGERYAVKTFIMMPPTVYGRGTGWFKTQSHQIPILIRNAIKTGYAEHVAAGSAESGFVHVADLAHLFECLIVNCLAGQDAPFGRHGYYFSSVESHKWTEVTGLIAKAGVALGILQSDTARSINLQEAGEKFADGNVELAEQCFGSISRTRPFNGLAIGWIPVKTEQDWRDSIKESFEDILYNDILRGV